jgi:hypothetical protein
MRYMNNIQKNKTQNKWVIIIWGFKFDFIDYIK